MSRQTDNHCYPLEAMDINSERLFLETYRRHGTLLEEELHKLCYGFDPRASHYVPRPQ